MLHSEKNSTSAVQECLFLIVETGIQHFTRAIPQMGNSYTPMEVCTADPEQRLVIKITILPIIGEFLLILEHSRPSMVRLLWLLVAPTLRLCITQDKLAGLLRGACMRISGTMGYMIFKETWGRDIRLMETPSMMLILTPRITPSGYI